MLRQINWNDPSLDPQDVCGWLGVKGNVLGHEVAVSISAPTRPPVKRGLKAGYSSQDTILISMGRMLIGMGIQPHRVRIAVDAVKRSWDTIAPGQIDIENENAVTNQDLFMLGTESPEGFQVEIVDGDHMQRVMFGNLRDGKPRIVLNLTAFIMASTFDLGHFLRESGRHLP